MREVQPHLNMVLPIWGHTVFPGLIMPIPLLSEISLPLHNTRDGVKTETNRPPFATNIVRRQRFKATF